MPAHALALATCLGPVPGQNHRNICETPVLADNSRPFEPGGCVFTTTVHTNVNHCMISYALSEAGCQFSMLWRPPRNARSPSFRALIILTNRISRPKISAAAAQLATTCWPHADHGKVLTHSTSVACLQRLWHTNILDNFTDINNNVRADFDIPQHMRPFNNVSAAFSAVTSSKDYRVASLQYKALLSSSGDFTAACPSGPFGRLLATLFFLRDNHL